MAEVILHLGAHGTDNALIATWLERNADLLAENGTRVIPAQRFQQLFAQALADHGDASEPPDSEALADAFGLGGGVARLAVSAPALLVPRSQVITPAGFLAGDVTARLRALARLLPGDTVLTLALAIARPSTIVPELVLAEQSPADPATIDERLGWLRGETLPWAARVRQIGQDVPGARLLVWRQEDLPRIWPALLARLGDCNEETTPVAGTEDFALRAVVAEGRVPMRRYIAAKPPPTVALMQRVAAAFAQGYGRPLADDSALDLAGLDLPSHSRALLARLDEGYGAQWAAIAAMEGVETPG